MDPFPTRILCAVDGSADATLASQAAVEISRESAAELHVVHVWTDVPSARYRARIHSWLERQARDLLDAEVERIEVAGASVTQAHLKEGQTADEIVALAEELDADLLVVGSRGLGTIKRLAMGSTPEGVVSLTPCPVLVMRGGEGGGWPPSTIIVGDDSSKESRRAGEIAALGDLAVDLRVVLRAE